MKKFILTLSLILLLTGCSINLPFSGTVVTEENAVAKIISNDETTYYDNFNDAWDFVNTNVDKDIELVLLTDWVAEDGVFGKGVGYGETGNLTPVDRKNKSIKVTIDLNGYTLDRNLSEPVKSGNVMSIKKDGVYTIKNGTVTGGNTSDRGGAFWLDNNETTINLENLTITNNFADGNGGAIFVKESKLKLTIKDTTITNNKTNNYGGGMYVQHDCGTIKLSGVVVIKDNTGKDNRNNVTLQVSSYGNNEAHFTDTTELQDESEIHVAPSNFKADAIISYYPVKGMEKYFVSDSDSLKIIYGSTSGITGNKSVFKTENK